MAVKKLFEPRSLLDFVHLSTPRVSPGGEYVAYTWARADGSANDYVSRVEVRSVRRGELVAASAGTCSTLPAWDPRGEAVAYVSRSGEGRYRVSRLGLRGGEVVLYEGSGRVLGIEWSPRGYLGLLEERAEAGDVVVADRIPLWFDGRGFVHASARRFSVLYPDSGYKEDVTPGGLDVAAFAISPEGRRVALLASVDDGHVRHPYALRLLVLDPESGEAWEPLAKPLVADSVSWAGDKLVAFAGHFMERGFSTHRRLYLLDVDTGELRCLTCGLDRNLDRRVYHDVRGPFSQPPRPVFDGGYVYFVVSEGGSLNLYRATLDGRLEPVVAGDLVVDEFDVRGGTVAYIRVTDVEPAELWVRSGATDRRLTWYNRHILERYEVVKPVRFTYRASDGVEIEGWIMRPARAREGERYPAVLNIHGGPKSKFGYAFMFEHQLLASKGYAVIYINPRGSDGYSEEFSDIRCRYGERDFEDLIEGVRHVVESYGFVDAERLGVTGISYGGFMTNWIVAHTDMFKAAVSQNGIASWLAEYGTSDIGFAFVPDQVCGDPLRPEKLSEKSPLTYASTVKTPLLLLHSMEDYRCYIDQALLMFTTLKSLGKEARLALFREGGHVFGWTGKPLHRVKRLELMLEWFDAHLKPKRNGGA